MLIRLKKLSFKLDVVIEQLTFFIEASCSGFISGKIESPSIMTYFSRLPESVLTLDLE